MVSIPIVCDELPSSNGSPLKGLFDNKVLGTGFIESLKSVFAIINNNNNNSNNNCVSCENGFSLNASEHATDASQTNNKTKNNKNSSIPGLTENESSSRLFDVPFVGEDKPFAGILD